MAHLIVGDTTTQTARIWLRGDSRHDECTVTLMPADDAPQHIRLDEGTDFTGTVDFRKLTPNTDYTVTAAFSVSSEITARFKTFAERGAHGPVTFSFVVSSCNLSVVSISNLLALLLAKGGARMALSSLDLPKERWRWPRCIWLRPLLERLLRFVLRLVSRGTEKATEIKQPGTPYLRSPFLRLAAVFDAQILQIETEPGGVPGAGSTLECEKSGAKGSVACAASSERDNHGMSLSDPTPKQRKELDVASGVFVKDAQGPAAKAGIRQGDVILSVGSQEVKSAEQFNQVISQYEKGKTVALRIRRGDSQIFITLKPLVECAIVVTHLDGRFEDGDVLFKQVDLPAGNEETQPVAIRVTKADPAKPWYDPPAFFLHVGDQIYYDFPNEDRRPERSEYRLAYREAWFEDVGKRYVLSHWPQYMTLDDHEIADQFARDFNPPTMTLDDHEIADQSARDFKSPTDRENRKQVVADPGTYRQEAIVAYREYARALGPSTTDQVRAQDGPFWYDFEKDGAAFFVLDTRTQRETLRKPPNIIDDGQMAALLAWLTHHKRNLKFVVTSVPFVAEISEKECKKVARWTSDEDRNDPNDKWSAFTRQREQIIEHVAAEEIEHLVFLTGDMHCCYHASMRISPKEQRSSGESSKYRSITLHELAGGPVNQLQLATRKMFNQQSRRTSAKGITYAVELERFHGEVNAVLHIKVTYVKDPQITSRDPEFTPIVEWNVIRTLTDTGVESWSPMSQSVTPRPAAPCLDMATREAAPDAAVGEASSSETVMTGRITFTRRREIEDLRPWNGDGAPAGVDNHGRIAGGGHAP